MRRLLFFDVFSSRFSDFLYTKRFRNLFFINPETAGAVCSSHSMLAECGESGGVGGDVDLFRKITVVPIRSSPIDDGAIVEETGGAVSGVTPSVGSAIGSVGPFVGNAV